MNKKKLDEGAKFELVRELVNTRNFCGNEREVLKEWQAEYDIPESVAFEICMKVNEAWDMFLTKGYCAY